MSEPRSIEPQDIRVGMRVRRTWRSDDDSRGDWAEFVVTEIDSGIIMRSGGVGWPADKPNVTWTLLADAPVPEPEPERCSSQRGGRACDRPPHDGGRHVCYHGGVVAMWSDPPIPAFNPAALWPHELSKPQCGAKSDETQMLCCRAANHDGLHAAYVSHAEGVQPVYVWGDPR